MSLEHFTTRNPFPFVLFFLVCGLGTMLFHFGARDIAPAGKLENWTVCTEACSSTFVLDLKQWRHPKNAKWRKLDAPILEAISITDNAAEPSVRWYKTHLVDNQSLENPVLFLSTVFTDVVVTIGGQQVYTFDSLGAHVLLPWHAIPLDLGDIGKPLYVGIRTNHNRIGIEGKVFVIEDNKILIGLLGKDLFSLISAAAYLFIGCGVLGAIFFLKEKLLLLSFGIALISSAIYIFISGYSKQLWFEDWLSWYTATTFCAQLVTVSSFTYFKEVLAPHTSLFLNYCQKGALIVLLVVYGVLASYAFAPNPVIPISISKYIAFTYPVFALAMLFEAINIARKGNKNALILVVGLVFTDIVVLHDTLIRFGYFPNQPTFWFPLASMSNITAFTLVLLSYLSQSKVQTQTINAKLAEKSKEKESIIQDLHDGIGGITTNIALLSELAKRQTDKKELTTLLNSIDDLSKEGIEEVKRIIQSAESNIQSWVNFRNELSKMLGRILSTHNIKHSVVMRLEHPESNPKSIIALNIFRIIEELAEKVVKEKAYSHLAVLLDGDGLNYLVCKIEISAINTGNDKKSGVDSGSTLDFRNIHKRIQSLGGLIFEPCQGSLNLQFEIPIASQVD